MTYSITMNFGAKLQKRFQISKILIAEKPKFGGFKKNCNFAVSFGLMISVAVSARTKQVCFNCCGLRRSDKGRDFS